MKKTTLSLLLLFALFGCPGEKQNTPPQNPVGQPTDPDAEDNKTTAPNNTPTEKPAEPQKPSGPPLIPRKLLFGNPDKASPQLSPDGKWLSWLAAKDGVLNVWIAPLDDLPSAKAITNDKSRGVRSYFWAYDNEHILYLQDKGGDENWRAYSVNVKTNAETDLTPIVGVQARILNVSHKLPKEILIGLNDRDPKYHDLYRLELSTGKKTLVEKNEAGFTRYITDDQYKVRFAIKAKEDGSNEVLSLNKKGKWDSFLTIPLEDNLTTSPLFLDKSGKSLYMSDSRSQDTAALISLDIAKKKASVLASDPKADIGGILVHPTEQRIQAVSFEYTKTRWEILDPALKEDIDTLTKVAEGELNVQSRTLDDSRWIVSYLTDNGPVKYYRYDRKEKKATFLFSNRSELESVTLAKMHPEVIKASDGLELVSYVTLPAASDPDGDGRPSSPVPMVLLVHGGPWGRDSWGLNPQHQWLADRGYAVLSVNFRGSAGFGKKFLNAGNLEWAGKMHQDLLDAVSWAVEQKITPKDKVCIMGGSYGGYSTLVGLTFTPDVFACGVDIVGPSNLITLLSTIPPYWAPLMETFARRVGDPRTEEGKKLLTERSPLTRVDKIQKPLLIGQGANDPRVKQAESDQIVQAMKAKKLPVTYVLFPDEGHGFARPENRTAFNAVTESFLAKHLGGRAQPIGEDFAGSSITIPEGASHIPGLSEAMKQMLGAK